MTSASPGPLAGRTIALPETRELDRLASILEQEGATTVRCPLVSILDAPDPAPVDAWLRELGDGGFDDLVILTGEGLKRLLDRARRIDLEAAVIAALRTVRKITRGPKPARVLHHELGLATDLPAVAPTSQGIIETLGPIDLQGRRVGVQLYGTEPNEPLVRFLTSKGAMVRTVAPYIYAPASDEDKVADLIERTGRGEVDVVAFTSGAQVERLFAVAEARKLGAELEAALARTKVAAIGPVVVDVLARRGVRIDIVPESAFVMKRLTGAIVKALTVDAG